MTKLPSNKKKILFTNKLNLI